MGEIRSRRQELSLSQITLVSVFGEYWLDRREPGFRMHTHDFYFIDSICTIAFLLSGEAQLILTGASRGFSGLPTSGRPSQRHC